MESANHNLLRRGVCCRVSGQERRTNRENGSEFTGKVIDAFVASIGHQEYANRAQAGDKDIAHRSVVIGADRALDSRALENDFAESEHEWQDDTNDANGFSEV